MIEKRCKNCMHFDKFGKHKSRQDQQGLCRGVSPTIYRVEEVYETRWPVVSGEDDWCFMYFNPATQVSNKKES